jgi:hypothetical protein
MASDDRLKDVGRQSNGKVRGGVLGESTVKALTGQKAGGGDDSFSCETEPSLIRDSEADRCAKPKTPPRSAAVVAQAQDCGELSGEVIDDAGLRLIGWYESEFPVTLFLCLPGTTV